MAVSAVRASFSSPVRRVWEVVTSLEEYQWRSDLSRIERIGEGKFVEYTKDGFATTFTVTKTEPCQRWEFDLENQNLKGHWTGIFTEKNGGTQVEFTEEVMAKRLFLRPFVKPFLKKQQRAYLADLQKALEL